MVLKCCHNFNIAKILVLFGNFIRIILYHSSRGFKIGRGQSLRLEKMRLNRLIHNIIVSSAIFFIVFFFIPQILLLAVLQSLEL